MKTSTITLHDSSGRVHADNRPAKIYVNGDLYYCKHGLIHREDGPAIINHDEKYRWYLMNIEYSFNDYCEKMNLTNKEKVLLLLKFPSTNNLPFNPLYTTKMKSLPDITMTFTS